MPDSQLRIVIEAKDMASGVLRQITGDITSIGGATEKVTGNISRFSGGMAQAGLAMQGIQQFGGQLRNTISGLTRDAIEAEGVTSALNAVIKSTGGVAGVTADEATKLADSLSKLTPFEDEAILSGENLLLTFTNIGEDIFPLATEAMLNMSQALGQDLKSSAIQLGKALQDPIAGATALRRVGVALTDEQEELIKTLVKSGDVMGAQKVILKELETEFGGAARAAGETFAGKLAILQTQIGNVREQIGGPLIGALSGLMGAFTSLPEPIQTVIGTGVMLTTTLAPLLATIGMMIPAFGALAPVIGAVGAAIGLLFSPIGAVIAIITLLVLAWTQNWGDIQGITRAAADGLGSILGWLGDRFGDFTTFVGDSIKTLTAPFQWLGDRLGDLGRMVEGLLNGLRQVPGVAGAFELAGGLMGFQEGGMVPGPFGAPRLAMVHGGEAVLTPQQQGGWGGLIINGPLIGSAVIREDADIERLAQAIDQKLAKRALGTPQGWRR